MIITFCGHSDFIGTKEYEKRLLDILQEKVGDKPCEFFLGGYGKFDSFAYECCKKYKQVHPSVKLIFITPYMTDEYQKNHLEYQKTRYDGIIFPEIENRPPKFAILYRNRYMVEKADYIIAYLSHDWGGAYKTYQYAKKKGKEIFNLFDLELI